jgi:hypothetical protein
VKHIFHIHSQINLLIACCVILNRKIPKENVLFICCRGVKGFDHIGTSVHLPDDIYYHPYNSPRNILKFKFLKNRFMINEVDSVIKEFTVNSSFIYYVPHCKNPLYQVFISNACCVQVHYIEDGGDAYLTKKELLNKFPNKLHWSHAISHFFLKFIPYAMASRLKAKANLYESIGTNQTITFGLTSNSFSTGLNESVSVVSISLDVQQLFMTDINYGSVFLFDALVEQNVVLLDQFKSFFEWYIDSYKEIKGGISIKFHPAQNECSKKIVIDMLTSNSVPYQEISSETNMEMFLLSNKNVNVYGIGSSLLRYSLMKNPAQTFILFPYFTKLNNWGATRKMIWIDLFGDLTLPKVN